MTIRSLGLSLVAAIALLGAAPALAAPPETHTFEGVGHVKLFERLWRPVGPPKAVLVIVHGFKDHGGRYAAIAERLSGLGYLVDAFDLRGHGRSEGDRGRIDDFNEYLNDLSSSVGRMRGEAPGKPVFVLGQGLGGAIAALYAVRQPNVLAGLALSAPALQIGSEVSPMLSSLSDVMGFLTPQLGVMTLDERLFSPDARVVAELQHDPLIDPHPLPAHTASELLSAIQTVHGHLTSLMLPLLVMHGTSDRITNPEGSRELFKQATSGDKTLKLYEGFYHDLLHGRDGGQVENEVVRWLQVHTLAQTPRER